MSTVKANTQTRFIVLFTSRSLLTWGNLQVLCLASSPDMYLLPTLNNQLFTSLQRLYYDRICILCQQGRKMGDNMKALWSNLCICPCLNHLELPQNIPRELLSISCLEIWGDVQQPHYEMAYLLVHVGDTLEAQYYGMALVWISPNQVWVSMMEEAVGTLSIHISSGPDWLYALTQLYKGSNHTPLPKGKHLGILP